MALNLISSRVKRVKTGKHWSPGQRKITDRLEFNACLHLGLDIKSETKLNFGVPVRPGLSCGPGTG